jgi:hypothetical protein
MLLQLVRAMPISLPGRGNSILGAAALCFVTVTVCNTFLRILYLSGKKSTSQQRCRVRWSNKNKNMTNWEAQRCCG